MHDTEKEAAAVRRFILTEADLPGDIDALSARSSWINPAARRGTRLQRCKGG